MHRVSRRDVRSDAVRNTLPADSATLRIFDTEPPPGRYAGAFIAHMKAGIIMAPGSQGRPGTRRTRSHSVVTCHLPQTRRLSTAARNVATITGESKLLAESIVLDRRRPIAASPIAVASWLACSRSLLRDFVTIKRSRERTRCGRRTLPS